MTRESLLELQDYDLWANQIWLRTLETMPDPKKARKIFRHILNCQHGWLAVVLGIEEVEPLSDDFPAEVDRLFAAWRDVITNGDPNAFASYQRGDTTHFQMVSEIAHHVFNHGTYHRGHLRGLADAAGFEGFEDTDFIKYVRQRETAQA